MHAQFQNDMPWKITDSRWCKFSVENICAQMIKKKKANKKSITDGMVYTKFNK